MPLLLPRGKEEKNVEAKAKVLRANVRRVVYQDLPNTVEAGPKARRKQVKQPKPGLVQIRMIIVQDTAAVLKLNHPLLRLLQRHLNRQCTNASPAFVMYGMKFLNFI